MDFISLNVFKNSFGPMIALMNEYDIEYQIQEKRAGVVTMAADGVIEVLKTPALWGALAAVIVAYIRTKNGRKVIITQNDNTIIHVQGLNEKELESYLKDSKNIIAFNPESEKSSETTT
jgi:hypothetical protein